MTFAAEVHGTSHQYEVVVNHTPTNTNISFNVTMIKGDGTAQTEANRDSMFQAIVDKLVTLNNVTFVSSQKRGEYTNVVTPT